MKKLVTATVLATAATSAMAFDYKINLEGRADAVYDNVKTTAQAGTTATEKYMNFSNNLIRLNMLGSISENLTYRFRYRFTSAGANPATTNATTASQTLREINATGVDYFFVDHKNSLFTLRLGKQNWGGAPYGREGMVAGTDVFLLSAAGANYKTAFGSDYRYGATAMFKFMDTNTLDIGVSNPNSTVTDQGTQRKNTGLAFTGVYMGSFLNKVIQPVLSYSMTKQNGDADNATATDRSKDGNNTMWNAGLRSEIAGLVIDADYKELKVENRNVAGSSTKFPQEKTKSIYGNVAFPMGDLTPMITYINDKFDSETNTADFKRNSFAVGTYYKPFSDVNFRYHAMFTNAVTKYDNTGATNSKIKDSKIYLGFKIDL